MLPCGGEIKFIKKLCERDLKPVFAILQLFIPTNLYRGKQVEIITRKPLTN